MSGVRLTQTRVAQLKPATREYSVSDTIVPSLSVRVYPSGTKTWVCTTGGRKVALGTSCVMALEEARRACLHYQVDGITPRRDIPLYQTFDGISGGQPGQPAANRARSRSVTLF